MRRILLSLLPCLLSAQIAPPVPAHIQSFQTTAKVVRRGATVTLRWAATGVDSVRLDPLGLILPAKGEITHLVTGRTVYWLHASNVVGGQSVPLVVDLVPEEQTPTVAPPPAPAPPPAAPALPAELPRLASLAPAPALPRMPALPVTLPASAPRQAARRHATRRAYIQFATTVSLKGATRLQHSLQRVAALDSRLLVRHRRNGRPYQLIRMGPFPSAQAAALRLQELAPSMRALRIQPMIILGPAEAVLPAATLVADSRQPE